MLVRKSFLSSLRVKDNLVSLLSHMLWNSFLAATCNGLALGPWKAEMNKTQTTFF